MNRLIIIKSPQLEFLIKHTETHNVTELCIFQCQLTQIPPIIESLNLVFLDLSMNNIKQISISLPETLTYLNLSFNHIEIYEETIQSIKPLKKLQSLLLNQNPVAKEKNFFFRVLKDLSSLKSLKHLNNIPISSKQYKVELPLPKNEEVTKEYFIKQFHQLWQFPFELLFPEDEDEQLSDQLDFHENKKSIDYLFDFSGQPQKRRSTLLI